MLCLKWPLLVGLALLSAIPLSPANASTVEFKFVSTVGGLGSTIPGTSNGQLFVVSIFADNGNSSILNQTWVGSDYLSATVNIGNGAYTASFDAIVGGPDPFAAATDALGNVTSMHLMDFCCNLDSLGFFPWLFADTGIPIVITGGPGPFTADAADRTLPENFSVALVQTNETPLPAALPLFVTGLGALGLLGWRRKRKQAA